MKIKPFVQLFYIFSFVICQNRVLVLDGEEDYVSELGDVNLTATVYIFDLFALSDFQSEPNSIQINESCADINGDNEINIFDVVGFVNMILNDSE